MDDDDDYNEELLAPAPKWSAAPAKKKTGPMVKSLLLNKASAPPPAKKIPRHPSGPPPAKKIKVSGSLQESSQQQVVVSLTNLPQGYDQKRLAGLLEYCGLKPSCLLQTDVSEPSYDAEDATLIAHLTFDCMPNALAACRELNGQEVSTMSGGAEFLAAEIVPGGCEMEEEEPRAKGWKEAVMASLAPARKREVERAWTDEVEYQRSEQQSAQVFVKKRKADYDEENPAFDGEKALLDYIDGKTDDVVEEDKLETFAASANLRRDDDSCVLKVSRLPEGYNEKKLVGLLEFLEVDGDALQSIRFLKPFQDQEVLTLAAVLEFDCHESARAACDELNGQEVITKDSDVTRLVAQLQTHESQMRAEKQVQPWQKGGWQKGSQKGDKKGDSKGDKKGDKKGGKKGGKKGDSGPAQIYPSVYYSDVPKEFNNESMRQLHQQADLDTELIMSMKFLPSRGDDFGETGCCIIRYADDKSAEKAIESLRGSKVLTSNGDRKFLGAKMAKPAAWMEKRY